MFAINSRPRNGGVTAAEELLIDGFMAAATIGGRQMLGDDESVVLVAFLIGGRLMAFETTNPLHGMDAHLVLVDDAVLQAIVALRALSRSANQRRIRLRGLGTRPRPVYKKSTMVSAKPRTMAMKTFRNPVTCRRVLQLAEKSRTFRWYTARDRLD